MITRFSVSVSHHDLLFPALIGEIAGGGNSQLSFRQRGQVPTQKKRFLGSLRRLIGHFSAIILLCFYYQDPSPGWLSPAHSDSR